jgi:hypothetical protein
MADTSVKSLLLAGIETVLQEKCVDEIPDDDETRAGLVKIGRHQESAVKYGIVVEIHADHLLGSDREERHDSQGESQRDGYEWDLPPETEGGSDLRWLRGTVRVWYHFKKKTREQAVDIIEVVVARIINALDRDSRLVGLSDTFGRRIHDVETTDNYTITNEGSKPALGHVFIDWRALMSKPNSKY